MYFSVYLATQVASTLLHSNLVKISQISQIYIFFLNVIINEIIRDNDIILSFEVPP